MVTRIVSGGQTGADRGALDAAIALEIEHGGYCPRGRRAEDGVIPAIYQLIETRTASYPERTRRNVVESDGTLLVTHGPPTGGSALTRDIALDRGRPLLHVDLNASSNPENSVRQWLADEAIRVLNVAGPRASGDPEIAKEVRDLLIAVLG